MEEEKKIPNNTKTSEHIKVFDYYEIENLNLIPLIHGDKKPVSEWKEYQQRKITKEEIDTFFLQGTQHNIGVVCGAISDNLYVLDFDTEEIFRRFFTKTDGLTVVKTGRGYHVYFKAESPVKTLKMLDSEGREIATLKGEGSYVVAPPSLHPSGASYAFIQRGEIPRLTGDVRQQVKERAIEVGLSVPKDAIDIETLLKGVVAGNRDNSLMYLIHFLRRAGISKEQALKICEKWNQRNKPPLEDVRYKVDYHYELAGGYQYFYTQDPNQWLISETLELQEQKKDNTVTQISEERAKIDLKLFADELTEKYMFKTLNDTEEVLYYEDGYYHFRAESVIRAECEKTFGRLHISTYQVNEITNHVRRSTYIDRKELNDPWILNLKNGVYNVKNFEFSPHTPRLLSTIRIPLTYEPNATCPRIEKFISEIVYSEHVSLIKEMIGYCLYHGYPHQNWFLLHGEGANAKSSLLKLIVQFLGGDNVSSIGLQDLNQRFASANLYAKSANIVADLSDADLKRTSMLKQLTGGDLITGEQKFKSIFTYFNFAKLIYSCNKVPLTEDKSNAFFRRVIFIPFPNTFVGKNADKNILDKLTTEEELSGLLNIAIAGLKRVMNGGFTGSLTAEENEEVYERASNPVYGFFHDWCEVNVEEYTPKTELYGAYCSYCKEKKVIAFSEKKFIDQMKLLTKMDTGQRGSAGQQKRVWLGIALSDKHHKHDNQPISNIRYCKTGNNIYNKSNNRDIEGLNGENYAYGAYGAYGKANCERCGKEALLTEYQGIGICSECIKELKEIEETKILKDTEQTSESKDTEQTVRTKDTKKPDDGDYGNTKCPRCGKNAVLIFHNNQDVCSSCLRKLKKEDLKKKKTKLDKPTRTVNIEDIEEDGSIRPGASDKKQDKELGELIKSFVIDATKEDDRGAMTVAMANRIANDYLYETAEVKAEIDKMVQEGELLMSEDDYGEYVKVVCEDGCCELTKFIPSPNLDEDECSQCGDVLMCEWQIEEDLGEWLPICQSCKLAIQEQER